MVNHETYSSRDYDSAKWPLVPLYFFCESGENRHRSLATYKR